MRAEKAFLFYGERGTHPADAHDKNGDVRMPANEAASFYQRAVGASWRYPRRIACRRAPRQLGRVVEDEILVVLLDRHQARFELIVVR